MTNLIAADPEPAAFAARRVRSLPPLRRFDPSVLVLMVLLGLHSWWNWHLWNRTQELQTIVSMLNEERAKLHVRLIAIEAQRP